MLIVVVIVVLALIVVSVIFFSSTALVLPPGSLAPPYHLNYIPIIVIIFIKVLELIMLFMVVIRTVDSIVVLSVFLSTLLLLGQTGTLVLLYHLNKDSYYCDYFYQSSGTHYISRGGHSYNGNSCGAFFVYPLYSYATTHWTIGATLSFKPLLFYCDYFYQSNDNNGTYIRRGGHSNDKASCGIFFMYIIRDGTFNHWGIGANLSFKPVIIV